MTRLISFLAALIVLLSATAEVASFVIDHQSWIQKNFIVARDYVVALTRMDQPPPRPCDTDCPSAASHQDAAHRCDGIEPLGKKILCHITLPKADAACRKDCDQKDKRGLPGNWIRRDKGDMASIPPIR